MRLHRRAQWCGVVACCEINRVLRMPVVARCQDGRPRGATAAGLQVLVGSLTQDRHVKCLMGHNALQSRILVFTFFHPLYLNDFESTVLLARVVVGLISDADLSNYVLQRCAALTPHLFHATF